MKYMKANGFNVLTISSDGPEIPTIIRNEGIAHMIVPMSRSITPFQDLICLWQLIRLFRKTKPSIVHTHTPKAGLLGMWAASWSGVKVKLHTVAGIPWMESIGAKRLLLKWMEKLTYKFADKVFPNSNGLFEFITKNSLVQSKKLQVIGSGASNGIDLEHFSVTENLRVKAVTLKREIGIGEKDFTYIFIGRIVKDKGINELISAFTSIQKNDSSVHLVLVGPYENHLDPISQETQSDIDDNINIHPVGFQSDVRPWLLASDVLVFPSYREGFPNVPMQAGAMGLPIIATDINGCNEIIEEGKNGLLIPPKDEQSLTKTMLKIKEDETLRNSLQKNAHTMIASRFEQKKIWDALLKEYQELLSEEDNYTN